MMSFPARLLTYQMRVNIGAALLIWFQPENSNTVVYVIRIKYRSNKEGGGLAEDVQNRETSREEVTKDEHKAIQEQPTGQSQSIQESTRVAGGDCLCCSSIRKWSTFLDETKLDFV